MRDYIIIFIIVVVSVSALRKPLYGLYGWLLVSFMNIHRLGWGVATALRPGVIVAAATLLGTLLNPKPLVRLTRESILFMFFWIFATMTTVLAIHPDSAWQTWIAFSKMALFYFLTIHLVRDFRRLRQVLVVAVLCVGFYGIKGGIFSILTGGAYRIYGPSDSFIADNNELALALNMTLPIALWLAHTSAKRWQSTGWYSLILLSLLSIVFSFSRGAMVTLVFIALLLIWSSGGRFRALAVLVLGGVIAAAYVGDRWIARMQTITSYQTESSAASRLLAWRAATEFAMDHPLTGGGFGAMTREVYENYGIQTGIVSHSIYFGTLAEQGFPGLVLYLVIFLSAFLSLKRCMKTAGDKSLKELMAMLRISLLAFLLGGAFYERQYFDYAFFFISLVSIIKLVTNQELQKTMQEDKASDPTFEEQTPVVQPL
jgi:putative inorganic carbon (HCO3(-)) transporter